MILEQLNISTHTHTKKNFNPIIALYMKLTKKRNMQPNVKHKIVCFLMFRKVKEESLSDLVISKDF